MDLSRIPFDRHSLDQAVHAVTHAILAGKGGWLLTPNTSICRRLAGTHKLDWVVARATHVYADGAPIVWLLRHLGFPVPERVTGADLLPLVIDRLPRGTRVAVIGGPPGVAQATAQILKDAGLTVTACDSPPRGFDATPSELRQYVSNWVSTFTDQPQLVVLGLPFPRQEYVSLELSRNFPYAYMFNTGAAMNFLVDHHKRAPKFLQNLGMEWLWRLRQDPRRLARRYLGEDLPFVIRFLWTHAIRQSRA